MRDWLSRNRMSTTFLSATRYNRRTSLRWPFSGVSMWTQNRANSAAIMTWPLTRGLLLNNIPVVVADARGSGSAGEWRRVDLDVSEIDDVKVVGEWIKRQFWSNGKLAAGGVSYDGMSGIKLAVVPNSPVDILGALYTPLKPVTDLVQSNGMMCESFVDDYASLTRSFETKGSPLSHFLTGRNAFIPAHVIAGFIFSLRIPQAPRGLEELFDRDNLKLREKNWSLKEGVYSNKFVDDTVTLKDGRQMTAADGGISNLEFQHLIERKIPTYFAGGLCDSGSVASTLSFFDSLQHNQGVNHALVIGPWGHGGHRGCESPNKAAGSFSCGETDVFNQLSQFVISSGNSLKSSEKWIFVDGSAGCWLRQSFNKDSGWIVSNDGNSTNHTNTMRCPASITSQSTQALSWTLGNKARSDIEPFKRPIKRVLLDLVRKTLMNPPALLKRDFSLHASRLDFQGLAVDAMDLALVTGSRINEFVRQSIWILLRNRNIQFPIASATDQTPHIEEIDPESVLHLVATTGISSTKIGRVKWMVAQMGSNLRTTTGVLSRWMIVQHLMRLPLDISYTMTSVRTFASLVDSKKIKSLLTFETERLDSVTLFGQPVLSIPLLFVKSDFVGDTSTAYDLGVIAVIEEISSDTEKTNHYLTEGRALLSMKAATDQDIVIESFKTAGRNNILEKMLSRPRSDSEGFGLRSLMKKDYRLISDYFQGKMVNEAIDGVVAAVTFRMEFVAHRLREGSRLRLSLFAEDQVNFPWKAIEGRFKASSGNMASRVEKLKTWRIPLMNANGPVQPTMSSLWMNVPLLAKKS